MKKESAVLFSLVLVIALAVPPKATAQVAIRFGVGPYGYVAPAPYPYYYYYPPCGYYPSPPCVHPYGGVPYGGGWYGGGWGPAYWYPDRYTYRGRNYVYPRAPVKRGASPPLASEINRTGRVSVYGIHFDTAKANIKPESDATLKEVAKLLQDDPKLKLYVVGHTDNQGAISFNMDLSRRRAEAVVSALASKYGVATGRLRAFGSGPYDPVASNDSEDGRAKNRRVELVKQ
ncbi:MAG: hypothetical protein CXZ00_13390 [Acidobacteria bacterium]|nr:MAG: hypothetical protein CXZ00_13390 [Acidobacteriota bacterium]